MRSLNIALSIGPILAFAVAVAGARAAPAQERFVQVTPDVRVRVLDTGETSTRPTLVLVPGWRLTADIWKSEIERFSKERRVVAIDPRSQGGSTKTTDGDIAEVRAEDLRAVLAQLKPGPIVLVGWSQGVQDVAAYVERYGTSDIRGVVLVDSTIAVGARKQSPEVMVQQLALLALYERDPRAYTEGMMRAIIRRPLSPAELDVLIDNALKTPTAIGAAMLIDDIMGPDRTAAIPKFQVPTLVIASATSGELEAQRAMAAKLPQGRFTVIADAAHAVFVDRPEAFDTVLDEFMAPLR